VVEGPHLLGKAMKETLARRGKAAPAPAKAAALPAKAAARPSKAVAKKSKKK